MNAAEALDLARGALGHATTGSMRSVGVGEAIEAVEVLTAALERARVVGVLDAWADKRGFRSPSPAKHEDGNGWFISVAGKLLVRRILLNMGGYDRNGTYFGIGAPLWWVSSPDGEVDYMLRAADRRWARDMVMAKYPDAKFRR